VLFYEDGGRPPKHVAGNIVCMLFISSTKAAGRLGKNSFLTGAQDSHLQRVTIPEAAYTQLRRSPPEDEQGNARKM